MTQHTPQFTHPLTSTSSLYASQARFSWRLLAILLTLLCASLLLFARLGRYALWDDEANTALFAEGICATGDTTAIIGHNLVAYEGGWELKNLRERYIPPLPAYLAAASMAIFGKTALAARLPFAMCGIGFFAVLLVWLFREDVDPWTCGLILFALLANVSLLLYFRQARYYGIAIILSMLLAYLYLHWSRSWPRQCLIVLLAFALLASNYISFGAAACCMVIDWCIWGRHTVRLNAPKTVFLFGTLALAGAALLSVYNPFDVSQPAPPQANHNELLQLSWNLRDLSINEFCIIPLLTIVPLVWLWRHDLWLLRGGLALLVYFTAINCVEPHHSSFAQLRFMTPIIPLCVAIEVRTLLLAVGRHKWLALLIGIPIFGTNLLSGSLLFHPGLVSIPLRSTICAFVGELASPPADPYRVASDWINANLPSGTTVCVFPRYASYPLMFHAPRPIYGWQLTDPPSAQFQHLPAVQFIGRQAPQYLFIFGQEGLSQYHPIQLSDGRPISYSLVKVLPILAKDLFRPELYMRLFHAAPMNRPRDGILILKQQ
jgi:hypothetical protein